MKPIIKVSSLFSDARFICGTGAFCGLLALACATALADRGRGSIRAEARPAPHAEARPAPPPRVEAAHGEPTVRHEAPAVHREVRPEPQHVVAAPPRRDWDENDEDARHFGGFAHGAPVRVLRGARVHDLPPRHFPILFHNLHYFIDDAGIYYLEQPDNQYLVVQPPVGVIVASLPDGTAAIPFGPTTYYYLDGDFYVAQDNAFAVVNPPPGIVVPALPSAATQVVINGTVVYQFNGFNYSPVLQDGVTEFAVTPA
jgi:hypothetical protein